jgi:hypothetical protein
MMLLCISLLSFSSFLAQQTENSRSTANALQEIDRTADAYANMGVEITRIIGPSTNITVQGSSVLLNETLPYNPKIAGDLDRFSQFESAYSDLNVSMNLSNLKAGTFLIQPGGTRMTHSQNDFFIIPQDAPQGAGSLSSYDLNVTFPPGGVDGAGWVSLANATGPNSTSVHVRVDDSSYSVVLDFYQQIDKYGTSQLNFTQGGAMVGYVLFTPPAAMQLHFTPSNMGLKASIGFANPIYVEANDTLSVISSANRTGRIRIA